MELAGNPPHLEVDVVGGGQVDLDGIHIEPDEEAAHLDALEILDAAVLDDSGDLGLVVDEVFEVDVAGAGELDGEAPVLREGERLDGVGEEARREAVLGEEVIDGSAGGRGAGGLGGEGSEEKRKQEEKKLNSRRGGGGRQDGHGVGLDGEKGRWGELE